MSTTQDLRSPGEPLSQFCGAGHTHELRYQSLFDPGRGLAFPCSAQGEVELDRLSERARCNYFFARSVVGREYLLPTIVEVPH